MTRERRLYSMVERNGSNRIEDVVKRMYAAELRSVASSEVVLRNRLFTVVQVGAEGSQKRS